MPHWMQIFSSHTGMSMAMLRFSYWLVAVGNVPSAGVFETGHDDARNILDEFGSLAGDGSSHLQLAGCLGRDLDFVEVVQSGIYGLVVHLQDLFACLAVGFLDGVLDGGYGILERYDLGNLEECCLHDDVDAGAEADL